MADQAMIKDTPDEMPPQRSRPQRVLYAVRDWCLTNLLLVLTIAGVVLGVILGFIVRSFNPSDTAIMLISFPGEILMRALKMLILPLIVSSLIVGVSSLDAGSSGRMGLRTVMYYFITTFMAIIVGICVVLAIHPGDPLLKDNLMVGTKGNRVTSLDAFLDLIRNIFPSNIAQAMFQHVKTTYADVEKQIKHYKNVSIDSLNMSDPDFNKTYGDLTGNYTTIVVTDKVMVEERQLTLGDGINVLGLIGFCVGFAVYLSNMGERGHVMVQFFDILNEIIMKMIVLIMWYSPFGIMFLIAGKIIELEDISAVAARLGLYIVTVISGLVIHAVISLPLTYFLITRKNPWTLFKGVFQAWITALATASSSATLPITFRCLEENMHMDKRVTRFVLPVGATINMDGTALYEAVAPIFIAQMNGIDLSFGQILTVSITATCAAIGAASIPSAGLVTMLMVLTSVGLPVEDVSLILAVDWFLDRLRTSVNVLGDSFGCGVVEHLSRAELAALDHAAVEAGDVEMKVKENGGEALTDNEDC